MPAPELVLVVSGLVALALGLVPILVQAGPRYRRVVLRAVAVGPVLTLAGGAAWIVVTAAPDHLSAALAGTLETAPDADFGRFRFAGMADDPEPGVESAFATADTDAP